MATMKNTLAAIMLLATAASPAFANDREGDLAVYARTGGVQLMRITDKAMLDEITRGAVPLDDHAMVVMNGGKFYLVNDHKMASGKMISEILKPRESLN